MNITLTGNLGGGKTSVCKELEKMGYKIISGGSIFRDVANEKGVTVTELNEMVKNDPTIDTLIDNRTTKLGTELDNVIFDSRLAWHFAPVSFKVFLLTDPYEAARRVFSGGDRAAESYSSYEDALATLCKRANLERERFLKLYEIDYFSKTNYDLIIESTNATPIDIAKEIIRNFEEYKRNPFENRILLNTGTLYPMTEPSDGFEGTTVKSLSNSQNNADIETDLDTLLSIEGNQIKVCQKEGYNYIVDGIDEFAKGIAEGKVFCQIDGFYNSHENMDSIAIPKTELLNKYEQLGDFVYRNYPADMPQKPPYTIDLNLYLE